MKRISEIIGYKKEKEKLTSIYDFLTNTDKYIDFGVDLPIGLFISGESGVGKSLMANALTIDGKREVFYVGNRELTLNKIKKIFKKAKKCGRSILLFDDVSCQQSSVYRQLVIEMNSIKNGETFVVATAENKNDIPDYFIDMFAPDMIMELQPPNIEEACEIFKPIFDGNKVDKDFNINDFCCFAQDFTYTEVEEIFNRASRMAIYEKCDRVSMRHLIIAGLLFKEEELAEEFDSASAYHEVGHAVTNLLLGGDAACIVLLDDGGGFFQEKDWITKTYNDKERRYIVSVAGKACEEIFTGTSSIGSYSDLSRVSARIEDDVKILASQGFEYFDSTELNSPAYNDTLAKKVQADIQKYYDKAKDLIIQNKPLVETFVEKLKDKFYLLHSEIYKIFEEYTNSLK